MVGVLHHDRAFVAADGAGDSKGQVVGLGPRAGKHAHFEPGRQGTAQPLGVFHDSLVEVTGMCIQQGRLLTQRRHHSRMTVPNRRYIVVAIQEAPAIGVVEPYPGAAHQVNRFVVKQPVSGSHRPVPALDQHRFLHRPSLQQDLPSQAP